MTTKEIAAITQISNGKLLIQLNNIVAEIRLIETKSLPGNFHYQVHKTFNHTKGTIYTSYLVNITEEEIIDKLGEQEVVDARKFQKGDGSMQHCEVILLRLDKCHMPDCTNVSWHKEQMKANEDMPKTRTYKKPLQKLFNLCQL